MTMVVESGTGNMEALNLRLIGSNCRLMVKVYVEGRLISVLEVWTLMLMKFPLASVSTQSRRRHAVGVRVAFRLRLCNMFMSL